MKTRRYYDAYEMAQYILDNHNMSETAEEFELSRATVNRHLNYLAEYGFGEELEKNKKLYAKVYNKIHKKNRYRRKILENLYFFVYLHSESVWLRSSYGDLHIDSVTIRNFLV